MRKALFFLGTLNDTDIDWMASKGERIAIPAGQRLIQEGAPITELFIVIDGAFSVTAGRGDRELARLHSGEILGEVSFVDSRPPSATVTATENSVVLGVSRILLQARLAEDVPFAARFYRALSVFLADRLRATTAQVSSESKTESDDEIDFETLDNLSLAGARFEWLLSTLRGK